jgi:hypothetical protein
MIRPPNIYIKGFSVKPGQALSKSPRPFGRLSFQDRQPREKGRRPRLVPRVLSR